MLRVSAKIGQAFRMPVREVGRGTPPLEHRLALDPHRASDSPYRFEIRR